jgi:formylmethanofuran dehydrogenase subunit D
MKAIVIRSKRGTWTSKSCRELLNIRANQSVYVIGPDGQLIVTIKKAPGEASRTMNAALKHLNGTSMIALDRDVMRSIGVVPGDIVKVSEEQEIQAVDVETYTSDRERPTTLAQRLAEMTVGAHMVLTASQYKSSIYKAAKDAGVEFTKLGNNTIKIVG